MVSVDVRQSGELGFESLLRHFFKNLNQHLALQGPPAGQTVRHPPLYDHKPVVKPFKKMVDNPLQWQSDTLDNS